MTVRIIHGEAVQQLAQMDAASVDAIITDPPYCSGALSEAGKARASHQGLRSETIRSGRFSWFDGDNMTTAGLAWLLREVAIEATRVLLPSGHLLVFCDWRMSFTLGPAMESAGLRLRNIIVWDKGHFGTGIGFRPQHEMILHLAMPDPVFHTADVGNVITSDRVPRDEREHPTQKPDDLLRKLIRVTTPVGGLVVDPFAGSGSIGIAARTERRRAILIDRNGEYCDAARTRLAGGPLFAGAAQ